MNMKSERTTALAKRTARELRKNMTEAERIMWSRLRRGQKGGLNVRRQHPKQTYILDFYIPSVHLAIEIDGSVHDEDSVWKRDELRERNLKTWGIDVMRISNKDIYNCIDGVVEMIERRVSEIKKTKTPLSLLSGERGRLCTHGRG